MRDTRELHKSRCCLYRPCTWWKHTGTTDGSPRLYVTDVRNERQQEEKDVASPDDLGPVLGKYPPKTPPPSLRKAHDSTSYTRR